MGIDYSGHLLGESRFCLLGELGESILVTYLLGDLLGEDLLGAMMKGCFQQSQYTIYFSCEFPTNFPIHFMPKEVQTHWYQIFQEASIVIHFSDIESWIICEMAIID